MRALTWSVLVLLILAAPAFVGANPLPPERGSLAAELIGLAQADEGNAGATVARTLRAIARADGVDVPEAYPCPSLAEGVRLHAARLKIPTPPVPALVGPDLERALGCLLGATHAANLAMDATMEGLSRQEIFDLYQADDEPRDALLDLLVGRSHDANLIAAIHMAEAVELALPVLTSATMSSASPPLIDLPPILALDALDDTLRDKNYALSIDLLGDDVYDNHGGGIFLAVGNAFYEVESGSPWFTTTQGGQNIAVAGNTQDADFAFSVGLAIDLAGNDTWGVKRDPILADLANNCGTSPRVPIVDTIGGGVFGVGMAFDLSGDNHYYGRTQTQGAGHVLGVGVLYVGPGQDDHEGVRAAMGSGLLGGIGVLIDAGGNSNYTLTAPTGGVFNGDRHLCDADPRYGMGSSFDRKEGTGPPPSKQYGLLIELGGDDTYNASHRAQAFGQGVGLGLLLDVTGNDHYIADTVSQGAGHGRAVDHRADALYSSGLALLADLSGNDEYSAASNSQGWALGDYFDDPTPPTTLDPLLQWTVKREEAIGIFFDATGEDTYSSLPNRANDMHNIDGAIGVFIDAQ